MHCIVFRLKYYLLSSNTRPAFGSGISIKPVGIDVLGFSFTSSGQTESGCQEVARCFGIWCHYVLYAVTLTEPLNTGASA